MQFVSQLVSQFCCDPSCTRNCKVYISCHAINKSCNIFVATTITRSRIRFYFLQRVRQRCNNIFKALQSQATSLAMFIHWMASYWLLTDNMAPNVSTRGFYTIFNNDHCKLHGTYCLVKHPLHCNPEIVFLNIARQVPR